MIDNNFFENMNNNDLIRLKENIINNKIELTEQDIYSILKIKNEDSLKKLFWLSSEIRKHFFKNKIFLYSFIYFSTYCKNNCSFCYYCSKNNISRYRLKLDELINICENIKEKPFHMIDLTMGEDIYFYNNPEYLIKYIETIKNKTKLNIMISPGVIDTKVLDIIKNNVLFFALYQETYNINLFNELRPNQSYEKRLNLRLYAKENGLLVEDGILTGIIENEDKEILSIIESINQMKKQNLDQIRVMTFEPQIGTKFEKKTQMNDLMELKTIAIFRILFPEILIPASLDIDGINGMKKRILAGANVVTSIIQQNTKLDGVVNFDKNIEYNKRKRDVDTVIASLKELDMIPATMEDFQIYIKKRKNYANKKIN